MRGEGVRSAVACACIHGCKGKTKHVTRILFTASTTTVPRSVQVWIRRMIILTTMHGAMHPITSVLTSSSTLFTTLYFLDHSMVPSALEVHARVLHVQGWAEILNPKPLPCTHWFQVLLKCMHWSCMGQATQFGERLVQNTCHIPQGSNNKALRGIQTDGKAGRETDARVN